MIKPIFQVISGSALSASEIDAAIAAIEFAPALKRPAAEWLAGAAGGDQAAEAHAALKGALVGAEAQLAILRAAEVRFAIAGAAAGCTADYSP
jgi:hypothetical protein